MSSTHFFLTLLTVPKVVIRRIMPFLLSVGFNTELSKILIIFTPSVMFNWFYSSSSVSSFFKSKDFLPRMQKSSVLQVCWLQLQLLGQAGLQLHIRIYKQLGISYRIDSFLTSSEHSAIGDYYCSLYHPKSVGNFKGLCTTSSELEMKVLESLYLIMSLNDSTSSFNLQIL